MEIQGSSLYVKHLGFIIMGLHNSPISVSKPFKVETVQDFIRNLTAQNRSDIIRTIKASSMYRDQREKIDELFLPAIENGQYPDEETMEKHRIHNIEDFERQLCQLIQNTNDQAMQAGLAKRKAI